MSDWRYELFGKKAEDLLHGRLAITFNEGQVELFDTTGTGQA